MALHEGGHSSRPWFPSLLASRLAPGTAAPPRAGWCRHSARPGSDEPDAPTRSTLHAPRSTLVLPALVYLAGFCLLTYPLIRAFPSAFFADEGDGLQNVWNLWWVNLALTRLHTSPWWTPLLHYPGGVSLVGQTLNPFDGFVAVALLPWLSLVETYNAIVVFSFVMGGVTAFWLARALGGAYWSSLVGGALFTFANYHFAHAQGHLQLVALEWLPLFLLCWQRLLVAP
ncbi:MAG TPA: hypothetical protein VFW96_06560, partial [Thermomicrobiales bacterium]|nr:hypothetical protein [Thermomicrobiales bacterium]